MIVLFAVEIDDTDSGAAPCADDARLLCKLYRWSISRAAKTLGVSRQSYHNWLNGDLVDRKHRVKLRGLLAAAPHFKAADTCQCGHPKDEHVWDSTDNGEVLLDGVCMNCECGPYRPMVKS